MDGDATGLQRPALAEVRDALECDDCRGMTPFSRRNSPPCPACDSSAWTVTDPREAMELLQVRGLAPEDDVRRAWWDELLDCGECGGAGGIASYDPQDLDQRCDDCGGSGRSAGPVSVPPTIPDLVAYASLGPAAILRAEELARETVARLRPWGCPQAARVVWRVGPLPEAGSGLPEGWPAEANEIFEQSSGFGEFFSGDQEQWDALIEDCGGEDNPAAWWRAYVRSWNDERPCPHEPVAMLYGMGLALDSITADAITLTVPPVGAP